VAHGCGLLQDLRTVGDAAVAALCQSGISDHRNAAVESLPPAFLMWQSQEVDWTIFRFVDEADRLLRVLVGYRRYWHTIVLI
jgi:hypothetical protein